MILSSYAASPSNFAAQQREKMLKAIPRVTLDGLDAYVCGARAFAPVAGDASGVLSFGCVGLAGFHGIAGIRSLVKANDAKDKSLGLRLQASGYGDCITALGYVGLAAGMGPWALPLVAIGVATANYARFA